MIYLAVVDSSLNFLSVTTLSGGQRAAVAIARRAWASQALVLFD